VQYDADVALVLDLGTEKEIAKIHVMAYQRPADFDVARVAVVDRQRRQNLVARRSDQERKCRSGNFRGRSARGISGGIAGEGHGMSNWR